MVSIFALNVIKDSGNKTLILLFSIFIESAKSVGELERSGLSSSEIEDLQQLQRFLLSVTAKDVSLLITFRQVHNLDIKTRV